MMLDNLKDPIVFELHGQTRVLGLPDDATINRCFSDMVAWLKLATVEAEAEFPSFGISSVHFKN